MTSRYWFARANPADKSRPMIIGKFKPVSWEGWGCIAIFLSLMGLGALIWTDAARQGIPGSWMGFVFLTVIGSGILFGAVASKGDPEHTVEDYRSGRVQNDQGGK